MWDWLERFKIVAALIAALSGVLGAGWATYQFVEARYAQADEVKLIGMRLDQKILADRRGQIQVQIWRWDEKFGTGCAKCDSATKLKYHEMVEELKACDAELAEIRQFQRAMEMQQKG